jgi:hypothetical protein
MSKKINGLCIESLEKELKNFSIVPIKPKKSQLKILSELCEGHLHFDSTRLLDKYIDESGASCFPDTNTDHGDKGIISNDVVDDHTSADLPNFHPIDDIAIDMVKTLISMIQCLIDGNNRIPITLLSVVYDNQKHLVSTMLKSEWGKKLPDIWMVFCELLVKKQEVLDTLLKSRMMDNPGSKFFLDSLHSWLQFQKKIFRTCVSISIGYEKIMTDIEDAWQTLFDLERYVLEKIMFQQKEI